MPASAYTSFRKHLETQLGEIEAAGLCKRERELATPQGARVGVGDRSLLNLCANNYLGLAGDCALIEAAREALQRWGFGLASVRFICGTQEIHRELERRLSRFFGTEETILFSSCFDANTGLFETLLTAEDAVLSDELNHASIIDGIRLCKAARHRYRHSDMGDLEARLQEARSSRYRMIATDGVFSMDGDVANLAAICDLADRHEALVMVDDSHAAGFWGPTGKGSHEHCGVMGRVDILTGTLGKALGGASGGYVTGRREIIELLRQRARPYLFSNSVAPAVVAASLQALDLVEGSGEGRRRLAENTRFFREGLAKSGFNIRPGEHPIIPIMLGEAALAERMASILLEKGIYVVAFSYPVVPKGAARIRTQVSAAHTREDLGFALEKFSEAKSELKI